MTTRSPGDIPKNVDEPREPLVIDESVIGSSALDRLVDEPVTDKPAAPRTPRAAIAARRIAAQPPAVAPAPRVAPVVTPTSRVAAAIATGLAFAQRPRVSMLLPGILLLLAIGEAAAIVMLLRRPAAPVVADSGSLAIATVPPGARVIVDDTDRGATPLTLTLPAGAHRAVLEFGGQRREISVNVIAGSSHAHHLEFASGSEVATSGANGAVEIRSRPSGASVLIAGTVRGKTPLTITDLAPGIHEVLLNLGRQQLKESVTVASGATAQLSAAFPATSASPASGWIAIASPIELTILENGQVLGTTRSPRIMVPAGRHTLELVNERLGFKTSRALQVDDGKTASFTPELPNGTASVNALPWAEVWIADRKVGDTPLANLSLPIGNHQLVFRHPSLGERRQDVTITAGAATRVSVDMRK